MVASSSRFAYNDCFELMDKAIADPKGIQIKFALKQEAKHFRIRLHTARRIDREENMQIYSETHKMFGKSVYDPLTMRVQESSNGGVWLRLERTDTRQFQIESLSEPEIEPTLSFDETVVIQSTQKKKPEEHIVKSIRPFKRRL